MQSPTLSSTDILHDCGTSLPMTLFISNLMASCILIASQSAPSQLTTMTMCKTCHRIWYVSLAKIFMPGALSHHHHMIIYHVLTYIQRSVRGTLLIHNVEVMVYQYDRFFGYDYWMTSIPTITHIAIFCCILLGYCNIWIGCHGNQLGNSEYSKNIKMWVMVRILVIHQSYPKSLSY